MRLSKLALFFALSFPALGAWSTCASITVAPSKLGSSTLTNFPVLIAGTYTFMGTTANGGLATSASGYDVNFFSDAGCSTKLAWQTSAWSATGVVQYWVKFPSLSTTANVVYVGVGNAAVTTDQSNVTGVWDSNYKGVYHLNDNAASTTVLDSTSNAHNGTNAVNTSGKSVTGPFASSTIGKALTYNGTSDDTDLGTTSDFNFTTGQYTLEFWLYEPTQALNAPIVCRGAYAADGFFVNENPSTAVQWYNDAVTAGYNNTTALSTGTWYHMAIVLSGTGTVGAGLAFYRNGAADGTPGFRFDGTTSTRHMYIAASDALGSFGALRMAELRISQTNRSADWILADYNNQSAPATFYSISGLPLSIATLSVPGGNVNVAYSQMVSASGGTTPYAWSVSVGSLPVGLSLNASTGAITGTPTTFLAAATSFTVKVTDAAATNATQPLSIQITGNTLTAVRAGNWTDASTSTSPWCTSSGTCATNLIGTGTGGTPGYGDSVVTAYGLTCNVTSCIAGASTANTGASFTILAGGSLLVSTGNTIYARDNMTVAGTDASNWMSLNGGTFTLDSSLAPGGTVYTILPSINFAKRKLSLSNSALLTSTPAGGYIGQGSFVFGMGLFSCANSSITNLGSATNVGITFGWAASDSTYGAFTSSNCTYVNPGGMNFESAGTTGSVFMSANDTLSGSVWDPTSSGNSDLYEDLLIPCGAGMAACSITNTTFFDVAGGYSGQLQGATVTDNFFGKSISYNDQPGFTPTVSFSRNFLLEPTGLVQVKMRSPSIMDNFFSQVQIENPHYVYPVAAANSTTELGRNVFDAPGYYSLDAGDAIVYPAIDSNGAGTFWAHHSIVLPNLRLWEAGDPYTYPGSASNTVYISRVEHNELIGSSQAVIDVENGNGTTATISALKWTLVYANGLVGAATYGPNFISALNCQANTIQTIVNAAAADYNFANNVTPSQLCGLYTNGGAWYNIPGPGPIGSPTGYGQHDNHAYSPYFAGGFDHGNIRLPAYFDQLYLGHPLNGTAWATSTNYTKGQTVAYTASTFYASTPVNLICIQAHNSSSIIPGVTQDWWKYWELQSYDWVRDNTTKGAVYVDGALGCTQAAPCTAQQTIHKWTLRQWALQNRIGCNVDGAGNDAGSVPCDPVYAGVVGQ